MAIAPAGLVGGFDELEIRNSVDFVRVLNSQQDLFHIQADQLRDVVINQCRLTGVNPLSQEMAAGALSVKLGKRPRNMLNPKAIKHLQMIFSIKDEVKTREGREIAALCKITVSQVRDYFANQRAKMRKIICSARKNAKNPDPSGGHSVQASLNTDQSISEMAAVDTVVPSVPRENSGNNNNGELVQVSENINSGTAQVGQQCSVESTVIKTVEESASCSTQEETVDGISSDDKKFVENIFYLMRKEQTFSGQTKLMEWVLKICDLSVLQWFVTKGGLPILATWLSEAAAEEQTTLLLVIFKVFEHLPLEKALPVQMKDILQTVNSLRFYRTSDVPNRAKALLSRWSKQFLRSHAEKKQSLMGSKEAHQELMDIPEEILAIEGIRDIFNQSDPIRGQKLLQTSVEASKLPNGSVSASKATKFETKLRRKVKMVEQPDRRSPSKNAQVARAVPPNQSRPMSADDIQKAKMHNLFMKNKYGKDIASPSELPQSKDCKPQPAPKIRAEVPARKSPLPHPRGELTEPAKETTQITRRDERKTTRRDERKTTTRYELIEATKQNSQATKGDERTEPANETTQITRREEHTTTTRDVRTESAKETTQITRRVERTPTMGERTTTKDECTEPSKDTSQVTRREERTTTRRDERTTATRDERSTTRDECTEAAKQTSQATRRDESMGPGKGSSQATRRDEFTEAAKDTSQATRIDEHAEAAKETSQATRIDELAEPAKETSQIMGLRKNQFKWQMPPVMQIDSVWRIGSGENSKEVLLQNQRNRRETETFYATVRDIPPNPKDPWDTEMDYDDSLTPEIPIEPPHEADPMDVSHDNRVENSLVPAPAPAPSPTTVPVMGNGAAQPDMELLAVLLKNPELVFALTSGQGSNLSSQETMALLDTLKNSGQGSTGLLNGAPGGSLLPSPTPSDASTASWSAGFPMQPTTRVMQTHFLAQPQSPASLGLPPHASSTAFSTPQLPFTVNPASRPSKPPTPIQQKVTLPSSSSNPSQHHHLIQGPLPHSSQPPLLPTLTPPVLQPPMFADPPTFQSRAPSGPDHRDGASRGLYDPPAHNAYHSANQADYGYYSRGHIHPGQVVERYSIPAGPFLETWSPERNSVRPQEFRTGPQRKDVPRDHRPEFSRQWNNERRDWNRERDRDRDRDRSGGRDRGRQWPNGSRWHDRERDRGRR